jgi:hypothetical protein
VPRTYSITYKALLSLLRENPRFFRVLSLEDLTRALWDSALLTPEEGVLTRLGAEALQVGSW